MNIEAVRLQDGRGPGNDGVNQHVHREAKKHCGKGTSKHLLLKEECPRKLLNNLCLLTLVDLFLRYGRYVYALSGSLFFKMGNDLVGLGIMTFHSKPTRRLLKEEEAENYNNQANATADNEHGAPAEHGQNDHVHSGGNQSTAVSDQANVGLVLTALRGRSELGEGGVACGERSAKAQTHEEAASGQERCVRSACSNEAEYGEDRTADENCLLAADAVRESTCHKTTNEVADHGDRVEQCELLQGHPLIACSIIGGLENHTDRTANGHIYGVAERDTGEQPQDLLVEASDRHTVKTCCDAVIRALHCVGHIAPTFLSFFCLALPGRKTTCSPCPQAKGFPSLPSIVFGNSYSIRSLFKAQRPFP